VVKGYKQQHGRDYNETFAPVARMETIQVVLAITSQHNWKVHQMDVKSTFLNGVLKEEVYVQQPLGFETPRIEKKVYRLKKALYGLKKAPRDWYIHIDSYLLSNGFSKNNSEPTLYIKINNQGEILIIFLYVDDLIFTGNINLSIEEFRTTMKKEFEMKNIGLLRYFLGIEVKQRNEGIFISQTMYAGDILKRFRIFNSKPTPTPTTTGLKLSKDDCSSNVDPTFYKSMVGSIMYLTTTIYSYIKESSVS
jgi:hypothetical protein